MQTVSFKPGESLELNGTDGESVFIIAEGNVDVVSDPLAQDDPEDHYLSDEDNLGPGILTGTFSTYSALTFYGPRLTAT